MGSYTVRADAPRNLLVVTFQGFFSDDEAAVPIRAEAKVIVGSIVVELEEWERPGWIPPVAAEQRARK